MEVYMIRSLMASTSCALLLASCASQQVAAPTAERNAANEAAGGLSARQLAGGECGLFMWTLTQPRKLVFFSRATSGAAVSEIGDQERAFVQTGASGDIFGQFMTQTDFQSAGGAERLRLNLVPGEALEDGQRTKEASLIYTDAEGWETIVPVRGVRACAAG